MAPPRSHALARSRFAARANRALAWTWSSGLSPKPPLEPDYLWSKGSAGFDPEDEHAGRDLADIADFRERLAMLCRSLTEEADLNALGHTIAYGLLKSAIRSRHALGRMWRKQPALPRTAIAAPIVVVGQMRAGTTRVHRLLAADPRHSGTLLYNAMNPVRRLPDWRALQCGAALAIARRINPWLDTLHPFGVRRIDEEIGWLAAALSPAIFEAQWRIPTFVAFSEGRDATPIYREFARVLRSDAALMGDAARPRVLKCPQYAEDLAALLARFPDARVVVTRRDLDEVLASTVSVVAGQFAYQTDRASLDEIEREWARKLALRDARIAEALGSFRGPLAEVEFADLNRDWRGQMAKVYAALGLDLNAAALAAMEREQATAQHSAYRQHAGTYRGFARA